MVMEFGRVVLFKRLTLVHLVKAVDEVVLVEALDLGDDIVLDVLEG